MFQNFKPLSNSKDKIRYPNFIVHTFRPLHISIFLVNIFLVNPLLYFNCNAMSWLLRCPNPFWSPRNPCLTRRSTISRGSRRSSPRIFPPRWELPITAMRAKWTRSTLWCTRGLCGTTRTTPGCSGTPTSLRCTHSGWYGLDENTVHIGWHWQIVQWSYPRSYPISISLQMAMFIFGFKRFKGFPGFSRRLTMKSGWRGSKMLRRYSLETRQTSYPSTSYRSWKHESAMSIMVHRRQNAFKFMIRSCDEW